MIALGSTTALGTVLCLINSPIVKPFFVFQGTASWTLNNQWQDRVNLVWDLSGSEWYKGCFVADPKRASPHSLNQSWTAAVQDDCFLCISALGCPQHTQPTHGTSHKWQGVNAPGWSSTSLGQELADTYSKFHLP